MNLLELVQMRARVSLGRVCTQERDGGRVVDRACEEHLEFSPEAQQHVRTSADLLHPLFLGSFSVLFFQTDGGLRELLAIFTFP